MGIGEDERNGVHLCRGFSRRRYPDLLLEVGTRGDGVKFSEEDFEID
jgi:hypothetical protein